MDFLKDHFKPQPITRVVTAFELRPGNVIPFETGTRTIKSAQYGDGIKHGFVRYKGKTSVAWLVEYETGEIVVTHPRLPVRILD